MAVGVVVVAGWALSRGVSIRPSPGEWRPLFLLGVLFAIRYFKGVKTAPAVAPANDSELARYHDQIEKDLEDLD